jgi:hypothetical protein
MKGLMKICCGMTEKRSGTVTASARNMKAPTVKTDSKHNEDANSDTEWQRHTESDIFCVLTT